MKGEGTVIQTGVGIPARAFPVQGVGQVWLGSGLELGLEETMTPSLEFPPACVQDSRRSF